jgi:hypothetical protein
MVVLTFFCFSTCTCNLHLWPILKKVLAEEAKIGDDFWVDI